MNDMPCVPASRTLSSWGLANLREASQIQLFSLDRHLKGRSSKLCIWRPLPYRLLGTRWPSRDIWCVDNIWALWRNRLGVWAAIILPGILLCEWNIHFLLARQSSISHRTHIYWADTRVGKVDVLEDGVLGIPRGIFTTTIKHNSLLLDG